MKFNISLKAIYLIHSLCFWLKDFTCWHNFMEAHTSGNTVESTQEFGCTIGQPHLPPLAASGEKTYNYYHMLCFGFCCC